MAKKVEYDRDGRKQHDIYHGRAEHGRSYVFGALKYTQPRMKLPNIKPQNEKEN